jgi:hypothetical protein
LTNDEGFYSHDISPITKSCVSFTCDSKIIEEDIWDKALELNLPEYYKWETREW